MSLSRPHATNKPKIYASQPDKDMLQVSSQAELHWYEAYQLGYRPVKRDWPEVDKDDDRFNLKEKDD